MEDATSVILALFLSVAGFALLAWLLGILFAPLKSLIAEYREKGEFKRVSRHLKRATELMDTAQYGGALVELERSLILTTQSAPASVAKVRDHHQNILSRCLIIGEELDFDTSLIASEINQVEQLFLQKCELELLIYRAKESYQRFVTKQNKIGKPAPSWSREEYQQKISDISKNLQDNKENLRGALSDLFAKLRSEKKQTVIYH